MQHTFLRAKIIFLKSEMGWKEYKNAILFMKILLNIYINSLKGKY